MEAESIHLVAGKLGSLIIVNCIKGDFPLFRLEVQYF
jgi:hypothetical protein